MARRTKQVGILIVLIVCIGLLWILRSNSTRERTAAAPGSTITTEPAESAGRSSLEAAANPTRENPSVPEVVAVATVGTAVGAIDVRVTSNPSGLAAPHASVRVVPSGSGRLPDRDAATDADGRISFEDLSPGDWFVDCVLGAHTNCRVEAGHRTVVELSVTGERGLDGRVIDQTDAPIAGAEIWLSPYADRVPRSAAAVSDAEGRFHIQTTGSAILFGAWAKGYAPSVPKVVSEATERKCEIRLVWNGKSIRGRVHDATGVPIPQALVDIRGAGASAVTDEAGRFGCDSVPEGTISLRVAAPKFALWSTSLQPEADRGTFVDVTLEEGGQAAGTVRSSDGAALQGAYVRCGGDAGALSAWTVSSSDGTYTLRGLPSGAIVIEASVYERGRDSLATTCAPGCSISWDPSIGGGPRIGGIVVDESGKPMPGMLVVAKGSDLRSGHADQDGRFLIADCQSTSYHLEARDRQNMTLGQLDGVSVGTTGARLVVRSRDAQIRGTILDSAGRPLGGAELIFNIKDRSSPFPAAESEKDGSFQSAQLLSGSYDVWIERPPCLTERIQVDGLLPGEVRNLGEIRLKDTGSISLACRSPTTRYLKALIETSDGKRVRIEGVSAGPDASPLRIDGLPLAELRLRLQEDGTDVAEQRFTPLANTVTPVEIRIP